MRVSGQQGAIMVSSRLRVLLAESGLSETGVTLRSLCAGTGRTLELFFVTNRDSLHLALCDFRPDVSLVSLSLLQPDPPAAIYFLHHSLPDVPLILFADAADKELAVACLQVGATDYMLEGYMDERTLGRVLQIALRAEPSVSLPLFDSLPRPADSLALPHESPSAGSNPAAIPPLLLSVQLTNFESLRTVEGPLVADGALQRVAVQLQKCVRRGDCIAHVAPDKFLVVVADSSESSLIAVHRRITSRFRPENQLCAAPLAVSIHSEPWPSTSIPASEMLRQPLLPRSDSASIAPASSLPPSRSSGYLP
jgi:CheY-like chemotaxis protein